MIPHTSYPYAIPQTYLIPHPPYCTPHTAYRIEYRIPHTPCRIHLPYLIKTNARRRHRLGVVSQSRCSGYRSISRQNQPRSPRISPDAKSIPPCSSRSPLPVCSCPIPPATLYRPAPPVFFRIIAISHFAILTLMLTVRPPAPHHPSLHHGSFVNQTF